MEYDFTDKLDLEWQRIFQKHLRHFSDQNKSETYSFDDIIREVFCPDSKDQCDAKYEDKEIFEKCLLEAQNFLSNQPTVPKQTQIRYLLNIAKYVSKDESCFINLNASDVFLNITYLSQPSTEIQTKLLFMEFLCSLLEHPSGIKWLMETKYCTEVFALAVNYQDIDDRVSKIGYEILRVLLEKTVNIDEKYCEEIMVLLAKRLLNTAQQIKLTIPADPATLEGLKRNLTCLVEILEELLKNYSANVLQYILDSQVGSACNVISEKCQDVAVCLLVDRIITILSFFGFTEIFDGIKSIKQDPLVLSGFIKIIDKEIEKGLFTVAFELLHYALKYLQYISNKLPKYHVGDKEIDPESQLVTLQLEPILLEWTRLNGTTDLLKGSDVEDVLAKHPLKIFKNLSSKTLLLGFKIKDKLPARSFNIYIKAVENITRSKDLYSKRSLGVILNSLVYAIEAPLAYEQSKNNTAVTIENKEQEYILALLKVTLLFIDSFNLDWSDSEKLLDLLYIVIECSSLYLSIEPIILNCLILLQEIISRRFSPSMALLIDTADGLKNIGPLLYKTCFTSNWKVRKAVLEVIYTITVSANTCFSSFKTILFNASLPPLISTMALNDESFSVQATALKCLQQMIVMEHIEELLTKHILIDNVLNVIMANMDAEVTAEAIKLISTIYQLEKFLDNVKIMKIYKCLEHVSLSNNNQDNVQKQVVEFWRMVTRKFMIRKGWVDTLLKFPTVTFSKRIVYLTDEEVQKRCFKALSELSRIGCLNVFKKFLESNDQSVDAKKSLMENLYRFHDTFRTHKITPECMLFYQDFLDLSSMQLDPLISPQESDDILEQIISATMMELMPADLEFISYKDVSTTTASTSKETGCITPSEFVDLVYRKVAELSSNAQRDTSKDHASKNTEVYVIDF